MNELIGWFFGVFTWPKFTRVLNGKYRFLLEVLRRWMWAAHMKTGASFPIWRLDVETTRFSMKLEWKIATSRSGQLRENNRRSCKTNFPLAQCQKRSAPIVFQFLYQIMHIELISDNGIAQFRFWKLVLKALTFSNYRSRIRRPIQKHIQIRKKPSELNYELFFVF